MATNPHDTWNARSDFILKVTGRSTSAEAPSESQQLGRPDFTLTRVRYDLPGQTGRGYWELLRLAPDLMVVQASTTYARRMRLVAPGEGYVEFHFRLSGRMCLNEGTSSETDLSQPCLLVQRQAPGCEVAEFIEGGVHDSSVTIYCRPDALQRIFGDYRTSLPAGVQEAFEDAFDGMFRLRLALYPRLAAPARELTRLCTNDAMRLPYSESLVQQALCEVMSALQGGSRKSESFCRLSDRDVRQLHAARDRLLAQHTPPARIDDIARSVGLSSTKLKRGFKALFGSTLHGFANELRLNRALDLLRQGELSIGAVSQAIGYEYQSSFTFAFIQRFGIRPKEYRLDPALLPS